MLSRFYLTLKDYADIPRAPPLTLSPGPTALPPPVANGVGYYFLNTLERHFFFFFFLKGESYKKKVNDNDRISIGRVFDVVVFI